MFTAVAIGVEDNKYPDEQGTREQQNDCQHAKAKCCVPDDVFGEYVQIEGSHGDKSEMDECCEIRTDSTLTDRSGNIGARSCKGSTLGSNQGVHAAAIYCLAHQ